MDKLVDEFICYAKEHFGVIVTAHEIARANVYDDVFGDTFLMLSPPTFTMEATQK